jgi:glycosyltransferase involved in cell wall biosynthesis
MPTSTELPAIASSTISVLLPAHNAEAYIEKVIADWVSVMEALARPYTLVVIDDGSSDRTAELAEGLAGRNSRIRLLRHPARRGFGAAVRTGLEAAVDPLLVYCSCDPQFRPTDLKLLLKEIDAVHLVSAGRSSLRMPGWMRGLRTVFRGLVWLFLGIPLEPLPLWRGWRGHAGHWLIRLLFGVRVIDVNSEFKLFRRDIFGRIPIQSEGDFVHAEILAKANFLGLLMSEVPVGDRPLSNGRRGLEKMWADGRRVFRRPDFGPAVLVEQAKTASAARVEASVEGSPPGEAREVEPPPP